MIQIQSTGKLLNYKDFRKYSDTFIETGCAAGDGVQRALDAGFNPVISIEASEEYFKQSQQRFLTSNKVWLYKGKSVDVLTGIAGKSQIPTVFYLDAHVSGESSAGYQDWLEKGSESDYAQDKCIKQELEIILSHYNKHVIIIDDVNGLTDGHSVEYAEIILRANPDYKFQFYDENLSGNFLYKDKLLVAIP